MDWCLRGPQDRKQSEWAVRGSKEKGPGGEKQPKKHAPKMPGNALCAQDAAAREHANVSRRSQQHYATHEKMHSGGNSVFRSEEHTSELQSRLHLVCRLLLEKKKKHHQTHAIAQLDTN